MTFTDRAKAYALAITKGEIAACRLVRLSCQRFLDDLDRGDWEFKPELVERVCGFAELMPHVKGKWARTREFIKLEDWQVFILACLFGFVDRDGRRRFRQAYIMLPRKQGKSILAAVIGLYMLTLDGEAGAEVYCGATSEAQAWEVFRPAKQMAQQAGETPGEFLAEFDADVAAKSIYTADGSRFQPVIGKPGDGSSPHCAIIDEYHEHDTPDQFDTMLTGMGAREQPLALVITTAGDNVGGPCHDMQKFAEDVLEGVIGDDQFFGIIYTIDKTDDWRDFDVWKKANPNLGVSIFEDFLRARHQEAINRPSKQGINLTKHLNVWVSSRDAWLNMSDWQACADGGLTLEEMAGCEAWIGLDLATKVDVAALVAKIRMADGRFAYWPFFYLPEAQVLEGKSKNSAAYGGWAASGHLNLTPGDATDFEYVAEDIRKLAKLLDVQALGFDPYQGHHLSQQLMSEGLPVIEYPMQTRTLSPPMREMEAAIAAKRRVHPGNPMFDWMASNVTAKEDGRGNIYPRKPHGQDHLKIDGITAALMAEGLSMEETEGRSVYEERGILVF
ncbi:terminase [Candidatus Pacearchaeota archaeon]|nr:terminase [Candidatus Pacearchaeota archaeon]